MVRPVCAFIVVDVQNDFISGSLAISNCPAGHNGEEVCVIFMSCKAWSLKKVETDLPEELDMVTHLWFSWLSLEKVNISLIFKSKMDLLKAIQKSCYISSFFVLKFLQNNYAKLFWKHTLLK